MKSKIYRIKKSIRAISPVISVLLMIAIAVVASLVAYMWMMGYIGGKTAQTGKAVLIQSMVNDTTSGHLVVYVQNVGQGNVKFDPPNTAYVNSHVQSSTISINPLAPGQTTPMNTTYQVTSTDPITVKIVTTDGTFSQTTDTPTNGAPALTNPQPIMYSVTFVAGTGGSVFPSGSHSLPAGFTAPIVAAASNGYQFSGWTSTGTITFDSASSASTNAHISSDGMITANFVAVAPGQNYQVNFVLGTGGSSLSPAAGSHTYAGGSTVAISTSAATGYMFAGWTSTGTITFDSASSASTNAHIGGAGSISANFVVNNQNQNYQVTFILGAGGSLMSPPTGNLSYSAGTIVPLTATPAAGYQFSYWTSTGSITFDSTVSASTNAHIGSDGTITANFIAVNLGQNYQVTFVLGSGGASMSPAGTQTYAGGSTVAISTSAATGYMFAGWTSTGTISFDSASSASTNAHIDGAGSVTANFVAVSPGQNYQVTFVLGSGGASMSPAAGSQTYAGGSTVAISTSAATGYMFAGWTSTGTISFDSASSASTNAHIGSDGSITANFVANSPGQNYAVIFVLGSGGSSLSPAAGSHTYAGGSTVAISTSAATGYMFAGWTSTGTITFDSASSASTNAHIGSAGSVTANFVANSPGSTYQVTFVLGSGGASMTPTPGAHSYSGGSVVAISATAASGYQFSSWSSTGTITFDSASSSATNAHIGSDGTVTANFVAVNTGQNYQVTFVLGTGGASMSPAGAQSYAGGSSVAVSATALTGYQFSSWSSSGTISFDSASSASTNAHIGSAGTVTANFVAVNSGLNYQVVFNLGSGGASMSPAGTQTYAGGSIVSISAVAASGYQFSSWTSSGTITFDSATSASTNAHIGSAGSVTANFVAVNYQVTFVLGSGGASMTPTAGTHTYAGGSSVPLTATAASGYQFSGWAFSGPIQIANAAQSSTTATINGAGTITANFIAGSILLNTAFDSNIWDQGWQAGGNPPWYAAPGEGIGGSTAAKSDPYGSNSGPFTTDSLDTSGGTLIHITFTYKVHQTNSATDLRIAYSTKANPDLNGNSADFTYVGNLGLPGNNDQWYQGSLTIAKTATAGASITDSSAFTTHFWFRFESNLQTRTGGIVEQVWIDNVQITVS